MLCFLVWFDGVGDVVAILGIGFWVLMVWRYVLKVYVEGTCVFHVGWCREKFCEDIAGVFCRFNSSDLYVSLEIVLSDSVVADVDAPTMFIHSWLCRDVFSSLVVGEEVRF